ncbi:Vacuolar protein-sorting-associated protein 60 [Podospora bellae-mahoneyi]|uniref:Vacuolar protein-sorting-associated protein 60 n=1 Tax=Podospora bellae-mahoneyi TaxID=2093777 RepID=A0ABR0FGL2_9PEZI|nr:Vacuolar protein-sorting-associated protein 60 [Podospora bellae-mahoneyi]
MSTIIFVGILKTEQREYCLIPRLPNNRQSGLALPAILSWQSPISESLAYVTTASPQTPPHKPLQASLPCPSSSSANHRLVAFPPNPTTKPLSRPPPLRSSPSQPLLPNNNNLPKFQVLPRPKNRQNEPSLRHPRPKSPQTNPQHRHHLPRHPHLLHRRQALRPQRRANNLPNQALQNARRPRQDRPKAKSPQSPPAPQTIRSPARPAPIPSLEHGAGPDNAGQPQKHNGHHRRTKANKQGPEKRVRQGRHRQD